VKEYLKVHDINMVVGEKMKCRRTLKGHLSRIYATQWSSNPYVMASASQDGKLLVWDAFTTNKTHVIGLNTAWVMTCAFSPSNKFVAAGGLDNICSLYNLDIEPPIVASREFNAHVGYLSCCRFFHEDETILTSSGDGRCILWDATNSSQKCSFDEHEGDVMSVSICPDSHIFASGACDGTAKIWDSRTGESIQTFKGTDADINAVAFLPNGYGFATGSDDATCCLYDIRADRELMNYNLDFDDHCAITSVAFSISGRYLFAGYDDFTCQVFDTLRGRRLFSLEEHQGRVSCMDVNADGTGFLTGSWDATLKVWC